MIAYISLFVVSILSCLIIISSASHVGYLLVNRKDYHHLITLFPILLLEIVTPFLIPPIIIEFINLHSQDNIWKFLFANLLAFSIGIKFTNFFWKFNQAILTSSDDNENITCCGSSNNSSILIDKQKKILIEEICYDQGLTNYSIQVSKNDDINAWASSNFSGTQHLLSFTKGSLMLDSNKFVALVGHEIVHLRKKDTTIIAFIRRVIAASLIVAIFLLCLILFQVIVENFTLLGDIIFIIGFPLLFLYSVCMFIFITIDNRRFWFQIDELRADRLSCRVKYVEKSAVINLLLDLKTQEEARFNNLFWYEKMYKRYFELMDHPCLERRIKLIENYKEWSIFDYLIHSWTITKWFFSGKGWIGM